jgi:uncharacterized protein
MHKKPGRNDPCPCGSGKKYKQCCMPKAQPKRKISAKWINRPQIPNLMERTFGDKIAHSDKNFKSVIDQPADMQEDDQANKENNF